MASWPLKCTFCLCTKQRTYVQCVARDVLDIWPNLTQSYSVLDSIYIPLTLTTFQFNYEKTFVVNFEKDKIIRGAVGKTLVESSVLRFCMDNRYIIFIFNFVIPPVFLLPLYCLEAGRLTLLCESLDNLCTHAHCTGHLAVIFFPPLKNSGCCCWKEEKGRGRERERERRGKKNIFSFEETSCSCSYNDPDCTHYNREVWSLFFITRLDVLTFILRKWSRGLLQQTKLDKL